MSDISPVLASFLAGFESGRKRVETAHGIVESEKRMQLDKDRLKQVADQFKERMEMDKKKHELDMKIFDFNYKKGLMDVEDDFRNQLQSGKFTPPTIPASAPGRTDVELTPDNRMVEIPGLPRPSTMLLPATKETPFGPVTVSDYTTPQREKELGFEDFRRRTEYAEGVQHKNRMSEIAYSNEQRNQRLQDQLLHAQQLQTERLVHAEAMKTLQFQLMQFQTAEKRREAMLSRYGTDDWDEVLKNARGFTSDLKHGRRDHKDIPHWYKPITDGMMSAAGEAPMPAKVAQGMDAAIGKSSLLMKMALDFNKIVPVSNDPRGRAATIVAGMLPATTTNSMLKQMRAHVNELAQLYGISIKGFDSDREKENMLALLPSTTDTIEIRERNMMKLRDRILTNFNTIISSYQGTGQRREYWKKVFEGNPFALGSNPQYLPIQSKVMETGNYNSTYWGK